MAKPGTGKQEQAVSRGQALPRLSFPASRPWPGFQDGSPV